MLHHGLGFINHTVSGGVEAQAIIGIPTNQRFKLGIPSAKVLKNCFTQQEKRR